MPGIGSSTTRDAALQGSQDAQRSKRDLLELLDANPPQTRRDDGEVGLPEPDSLL